MVGASGYRLDAHINSLSRPPDSTRSEGVDCASVPKGRSPLFKAVHARRRTGLDVAAGEPRPRYTPA